MGAVAVGLAFVWVAEAQMLGPGAGREANREAVKRWTESQLKEAPPTRRVWPGVVADTAARTVTAVIEAVGDRGGLYPPEFIVVGESSQHDYESLAVLLAKPSDVARALEAIGMPRGRPIQPPAFHFWPRGERVWLAVRPFAGGPERPISACVTEQQTGKGLSNAFIYVGSVWREDGACEADSPSPGALVSMYNEGTTVLDVPRLISQNAAYGRYVIEPGVMDKESLWFLILRPERAADAPPRVAPVALTVQPRAGLDKPPAGIADLEWVRQEPGAGGVTNAAEEAMTGLMRLVQSGREPHVTLRFDDRLTVKAMSELTPVIAAIEGENGIRVDGPPDGQLYYKAYQPKPEWRAREKRLMQPYELRIERDGEAGWRKTFVQIHEDWTDESSLDPKLTVRQHPLQNWDALAGHVENLGPGQGVLLVFAPANAPLSAFMDGVRRVQKSLPTVYVFAE
jgi:hypothetical protein